MIFKGKLFKRVASITVFVLSLCLVLVTYGAIPFYAAPTLWQAIWSTGFSQSFINDSIFSIYARNFGAPSPAAIAFGLSGAWPAGILIKTGLSAIDSYTTMTAMWLSLAFCSAFKVCRHFSCSYQVSVLGALAWGTMPVIWNHSDFSMLSLGFALFPFYMLPSFKLFSWGMESVPYGSRRIRVAVFFLLACLISVFMDGYSFVMFAVLSSILGGVAFIQRRELRIWYLRFSLPIYLISFSTAYILYTKYVGKSEFELSSLDWVRAEGVDVVFLLVPARGISWIMDALKLSADRLNGGFFGNSKVWGTTFILPMVLGVIVSLLKARRRTGLVLPFLLCFIFSTYMALGPSLKVNSRREPGEGYLEMPASAALCRTGVEFIVKSIPGFRNMRLCYRWIALSFFCMWLITLLLSRGGKREFCTRLIFIVITVINLPDLSADIRGKRGYRSSFLKFEHDWLEDMSKTVEEGEVVAFLPWGNDFSINYIAARLKIITYNIGGDKNLEEARRHWPEGMQGFLGRKIDPDFAGRVIHILMNGEAERVIFPYVNMGSAAIQWPSPLSLKGSIVPVLDELKRCGALRIIECKYYASVELMPSASLN